MIKDFKCRHTEALFHGEDPRPFRGIAKVARRKLDMLDYATKLSDLASPPNNKLEALKKDRRGQHSIRINDQFRICFVWNDEGPRNVEIVDYH